MRRAMTNVPTSAAQRLTRWNDIEPSGVVVPCEELEPDRCGKGFIEAGMAPLAALRKAGACIAIKLAAITITIATRSPSAARDDRLARCRTAGGCEPI